MDVPTYSLAERDRRWALARELMAAEEVEALVCYGEHECLEAAPFAPDAYFSNDRPGSIVVFCRDADPVQLHWSNMSIQTHLFGPVGGFGGPGGLDQLPEARRYGRLFELPTVGAELPLAPGMSWAFEPSAVVGGRAVNLGGTVIIGEDGPIELNPLTAQLLRA